MSSESVGGAVGAYPGELECDVLLSDGRSAHLRPIRPDDRVALRALGEKLSRETIYLRFFSQRRRVTEAEIEHFVTVDYNDRLALVAIVDGELVAVARYDRLGTRAGPGGDDRAGTDRAGRDRAPDGQPPGSEAEVAFVVSDEHQGRGLGTVLLEHLASAAVSRGIERFVADTLPENHRMLGVFRAAGFEEHAVFDSGVVRVTMRLGAGKEYLELVDEREWLATVRSIERILRPSSIAVIGASRTPGTIGHDILRNLLADEFGGPVYPVNPMAAHVAGVLSYPSVADIAGKVDLAVIAVPAPAVAAVVRECGEKGVGGLVVVTAGFAEQGEQGRAVEAELVRLARTYGMRLVGPNCMGVINTAPGVRMNATFAPHAPVPGRVAFSSQSGGLGIAILGEAGRRGLGVSSFVSVGNKADVSGNDLLRFWEEDDGTDVILLYLESFGNPRRFSRVARRVGRTKPIVAVKGGRTTAGHRGASSHTAALASPDAAADALFRQAGVIRVETLEELFDVAELLAHQPLPHGRRVAVIGNAGGPGVLAADACESLGLEVPELSAETQLRLREVVSQGAAVANPVDLIASATAAEYRAALAILLADDSVDAVIVIFTPPLAAAAEGVAEAVAEAASSAEKPVLANFLVTDRALAALRGGPRPLPWYPYPESAARALARVVPHAEWLARPEGTVRSFDDLDAPRGRRIVEAALGETAGSDRSPEVWLDAPAAFDLLRSYAIPVLPVHRAHTAAAAVEAAATVGYPVAVKVDARGVVHKSDVGGVRLALGSSGEVAAAAEDLLTRFGPGAAVVVQPMAPEGVETIVGLVEDPSFGPLVMFGLGGTAAELLGDTMWSLVPMTTADADDLVGSLRSSPLLTGYRGSEPVDLAGLTDLLCRVARLAEDLPEVAEMDLNPVVASAQGVVALDVRVRVAPAARAPRLVRRAMRQ